MTISRFLNLSLSLSLSLSLFSGVEMTTYYKEDMVRDGGGKEMRDKVKKGGILQYEKEE